MNSKNDVSILRQLKSYFLGLFILFLANTSFANTIVVKPNTVISHPTTYNNVILDLSNGSFVIENNASLTITNSIINGTLSNKNPLLINVDKGTLNLTNNKVNISSSGVSPHPTTQSLQYVIQLGMASVNLNGNSFEIDKPFRSGFLITTASIPTSGIKIINNKFDGFHGVLYLVSTDDTLISGNTLTKNTYGNIVVIGGNSKIVGNTIKFSGNNRLGNGIDIIDASNIEITKNLLLTPTCHGIYIFRSQNVMVDSNQVFGGITYAINVLTYPEKLALKDHDYLKSLLGDHRLKNGISSNIVLSNNLMSQNRYGIAANDTSGLTVIDNIFIQHFDDNIARKFWTDNKILLQNVTGLVWSNNLYKEAFTQVEGGDNSKSFKLVPFPTTGGVSL